MKTSSGRRRKCLKKGLKSGWTHKQSVRKHNAYIYKIGKEFSIAVSGFVFLMRLLDDVHAQVGVEAARLSKLNRRRVITQREVAAAAVLAHHHVCA